MKNYQDINCLIKSCNSKNSLLEILYLTYIEDFNQDKFLIFFLDKSVNFKNKRKMLDLSNQ